MNVQQYAMVNKETNIIESSCMWDGNEETWMPPSEYLLVLTSALELKVWNYNQEIKDWELGVLNNPPAGTEIGFIYQGNNVAITPEPKPDNSNQPNFSGLESV